MKNFTLTPTDGRKTLNNHLVQETNEFAKLISYTTEAVSINKKTNQVEILNIESATTLRHVKHFLNYYGFKAENKKQIQKDYLIK